MTAATAPRTTVKPAKLAVEGVSRSFRSMADRKRAKFVQVLKNISFEMNEGEIVSVVGLSGCGKTTLLRIIGGLLEPDAGAVRVDGRDVSGPGHDRAIVFQQASLLPWRTALRNAYMGAGGSQTEGELEWQFINQNACYSPTLEFPEQKAEFIQQQNVAGGTQKKILEYGSYTDLSLRTEALALAKK